MKRFGLGLVLGAGIVGSFAAAIAFVPEGAAGVVVLVLAALFAVAVFFAFPVDLVKRWSESHGVPITPENRAIIVRHLSRGRRIRAAGAVLGYVGYAVYNIAVGQDRVSWGVLRSIFFGYLIAAAIAEVWALRLRPQGSPAASLAPREVRDYLPAGAIALLRIVPMVIVALAIAWEWIPRGERVVGVDPARPGVGVVAAWAGVAVAVIVFVEIVIRRIVRRPQPAVSEELLRVDDAIRSTSIHQLAGAGLALVLGILSARLGDATPIRALRLDAFFQILGLLTGIGSLFAWFRLGVDQPWVVRRSQPAKAAA